MSAELKTQKRETERWSHHLSRWHNCVRCELGHHCRKHVLARGVLRSDIVFIGEAPGFTEDTVGFPFVGVSGKLLDIIIARCLAKIDFTYSITNTICCIPKNDSSDGVRPPSEDEIKTCAPRLLDFLGIASPKAIILLGRSAESCWKIFQGLYPGKSYERITAVRTHRMSHPAFLLRNGGSSPKNLHYRDAVLYLTKFLKEVLHGSRPPSKP